ncbi:hypothetical protein Aduo_008353 [Ancylostoma duodenale]
MKIFFFFDWLILKILLMVACISTLLSYGKLFSGKRVLASSRFFIYRDKDERNLVYPRLRLVTAKLAEEGVMPNVPRGEYSLVFANRGT